MAVMQSRNNRSYNAGGDLSAAQFKFVKVSGANVVVAATLGEVCLGVLLNNPAQNQEATVCIDGKVMVKVGAVAIAAGAVVGTDANALAITAAAGKTIMGYATEAGAAGQIIAIEMIQGGNTV